MPYKNIVFIKLEKRLLNDYRWFMMSDKAQLLFIKLVLCAAETYNKIPSNMGSMRLLTRLAWRCDHFKRYLQEVQKSFPKFKQNGEYYYFEDFTEKTNYIQEIPRKSQRTPKVGVDIDKDKEKEKKKRKFSECVFLTNEEYEKLVKLFGENGVKEKIENLNMGIMSKGYKYKSHYYTILSWDKKESKRGPGWGGDNTKEGRL